MSGNPLQLSTAAHAAAQAAAATLSPAVYSPDNGIELLMPASRKSGHYALVYTANTGCDGATGTTARHNLNNLEKLFNRPFPVDYINTNFQSETPGAGFSTARIPRDRYGDPVPGNQIATVARGGNSPSAATQLGKALLQHYGLSAASHDVVLVYTTGDHRQDRIVARFSDTFAPNFANQVLGAVSRDQQRTRAGAFRS